MPEAGSSSGSWSSARAGTSRSLASSSSAASRRSQTTGATGARRSGTLVTRSLAACPFSARKLSRSAAATGPRSPRRQSRVKWTVQRCHGQPSTRRVGVLEPLSADPGCRAARRSVDTARRTGGSARGNRSRSPSWRRVGGVLPGTSVAATAPWRDAWFPLKSLHSAIVSAGSSIRSPIFNVSRFPSSLLVSGL